MLTCCVHVRTKQTSCDSFIGEIIVLRGKRLKIILPLFFHSLFTFYVDNVHAFYQPSAFSHRFNEKEVRDSQDYTANLFFSPPSVNMVKTGLFQGYKINICIAST